MDVSFAIDENGGADLTGLNVPIAVLPLVTRVSSPIEMDGAGVSHHILITAVSVVALTSLDSDPALNDEPFTFLSCPIPAPIEVDDRLTVGLVMFGPRFAQLLQYLRNSVLLSTLSLVCSIITLILGNIIFAAFAFQSDSPTIRVIRGIIVWVFPLTLWHTAQSTLRLVHSIVVMSFRRFDILYLTCQNIIGVLLTIYLYGNDTVILIWLLICEWQSQNVIIGDAISARSSARARGIFIAAGITSYLVFISVCMLSPLANHYHSFVMPGAVLLEAMHMKPITVDPIQLMVGRNITIVLFFIRFLVLHHQYPSLYLNLSEPYERSRGSEPPAYYGEVAVRARATANQDRRRATLAAPFVAPVNDTQLRYMVCSSDENVLPLDENDTLALQLCGERFAHALDTLRSNVVFSRVAYMSIVVFETIGTYIFLAVAFQYEPEMALITNIIYGAAWLVMPMAYYQMLQSTLRLMAPITWRLLYHFNVGYLLLQIFTWLTVAELLFYDQPILALWLGAGAWGSVNIVLRDAMSTRSRNRAGLGFIVATVTFPFFFYMSIVLSGLEVRTAEYVLPGSHLLQQMGLHAININPVSLMKESVLTTILFFMRILWLYRSNALQTLNLYCSYTNAEQA